MLHQLDTARPSSNQRPTTSPIGPPELFPPPLELCLLRNIYPSSELGLLPNLPRMRTLSSLASRILSVNDVPNASSSSGGSRNLERGVEPLARKAHPKNFGFAKPLPARKCIAGSPN